MILQFLIGASVSLAWDASPSPEVVKYYVYERSELQSQFVKVANTTALTITIPVKPMLSMQYAATAADASDTESDFSNIVTFVRRPTLAIRTWKDGPLTQFEISTEVYSGLNWILEGTRNFSSWQTVSSGVANNDALVIPFTLPAGEDKMFFRLKKNVQQQLPLTRSVAEMTIEELVNVTLAEDKISPLTYRKSTWWERTKHRFRYRPGHSAVILKGAERQIQMLKPEPVKEIPLPPLPFRVEVNE